MKFNRVQMMTAIHRSTVNIVMINEIPNLRFINGFILKFPFQFEKLFSCIFVEHFQEIIDSIDQLKMSC